MVSKARSEHHRPPMPVNPWSLWAEKARKSQGMASSQSVGVLLRAVEWPRSAEASLARGSVPRWSSRGAPGVLLHPQRSVAQGLGGVHGHDLETGRGVMERFHASTARAQEVGLSCGGNIEVLVAPLDRVLFAVEDALLAADREYVRVSLAEGPEELVGAMFLVAFSPDAEDAVERAGGVCELVDLPGISACCAVATPELLGRLEGADGVRDARELLAQVAAAVVERPRTEATGHVGQGGLDWFFARGYAQPQLVCIGGTHVSIHLAQMAKALGYRDGGGGPARGVRHDRALPVRRRAAARVAPAGLYACGAHAPDRCVRADPRPQDRRCRPWRRRSGRGRSTSGRWAV